MRIHTRAAVFTALAVLAAAGPAAGQDAAQPVLAMTAVSIGTDGGKVGSAGGDNPFVVGKSTTQYVYAGRPGQEGLCSVGSADASVADLDALLKRAAVVWKLTATGVKYEAGRQTLDLEWARYDAATGATPAVSRRQRITLAQGETFTVDLAHNTSTDCRTASIMIEVSAGFREDPALADTLLQYELWLVRVTSAGQKATRRFAAMGKQGAAVPFDFVALRSDIPKLQADQYDFEMLTMVRGELRGRVGRNDRVSIELDTVRQDRPARRGERLTALPGFGEGRKVVEVGWDEAVEIQLPSRTGQSSTMASAAAAANAKNSSGGGRAGGAASSGSMPAAPVSIQNGRLVVNYGAFFANDVVSVIVRVKKAADASEPPAH